jgi:hypothetical protein
MTSTMADAVLEGQAIRAAEESERDAAESMDDDDDMERYLGPSTLAKLRQEQAESTDADDVDDADDDYDDDDDYDGDDDE